MGVLGCFAEAPLESGVAGGQGGDGGLLAQPGAGGEGRGRGWYLHLSWGDRADTFSTCGQRAARLGESNSWGDPVSGPAPGDAADTKHQRAGNSKTSLVALPIPRTAQGLAGPPLPRERGGADG